MSEYDARFWRSAGEELKKSVREFEQNITIEHPDKVTTRRLVPDVLQADNWAATAVKYREYSGPNNF